MDGVIDKVEWFEQVLLEDGGSPVFADLAELLYEDGRFEEVVHLCERGLAANPHSLKGRLLFGLALYELGARDKSFRILQGLLEKIRIFGKLFEVLGVMYREKGKSEEALKFEQIAFFLAKRVRRTAVRKEEGLPVIEKAEEKAIPLSVGPAAEVPLRGWLSTLEKRLTLLKNKEIAVTTPSSLFEKSDRVFLKEALSALVRIGG